MTQFLLSDESGLEPEQPTHKAILDAVDKQQAAAKREEIFSTYAAKGNTDYLRRTYGVPFNDLWILERQY